MSEVITMLGIGILGVSLFVAILAGLKRKTDVAKYVGGLGVVFGVVVMLVGTMVAPATIGGSQAGNNYNTVTGKGELKAISDINFFIADKLNTTAQWTTASGTVQIYQAGTNLATQSANYLKAITVTSGNGSASSTGLFTATDYVGGISGSTTYYDQDWGNFYFSSPQTQTSTVSVAIRVPEPAGTSQMKSDKFPTEGLTAVGTVDDLFNETKHDNTYADTNYSLNDLNSIRKASSTSIDFNKTGATSGIIKLTITPGCSGGNKICKALTLGFDKNADAMVEGDEFSAISVQLSTGTNFGLPSDILNVWKQDQGVVLGDVAGGTNATYILGFTLANANITPGADSFKMCIDDLGTATNPVDQKDLFLNAKGTKNCTTINLMN